MSNYLVRNAQVEDYPAINSIAVSAWMALKDGYNPDEWETLLNSVGKMSNLSVKGQIIVADKNGTVVGAVAYMPPFASNPDIFPENWPSIRMLVTAPEHQGEGIGRRLVDECIHRAKLDHAQYIGLHTSPAMTIALPLYIRMGFTKDRELARIAGADYARYVLRL